MLSRGQRATAYAMSEADLQERIRGTLRSLGLEAMHVHDARRCWLPGWPDIVVLGARSILFAELKSQSGSLSPEQRRVANLIRAAGGRWVLWRPSHLISGEIARTLATMAAYPALPLDGLTA